MKKEKKTLTAKQQAICFLSRREYSRAELAQRLLRSGAAQDETEVALDELERLGLLSDERFAEALVRRKQGKYSKRAITTQLKEQGIDRDIIDSTLTAFDETSEEEDVLKLWRQRFGKLPENEKEKNKQIRFLIARGYSPSLIFKTLKRVKDEG